MRTHLLSRTLAALLLTAGLAGCAGYKLTPLASDAHDPNEEGYVFYAPAPFLMGTLKSPVDSAKGSRAEYEFKLVYLPDHERPYRFTRYEFLAKSDLKITFTEGWQFTGAESSTDSTAALSALVDLAKLAAAAAPGAPAAPPPAVLLFRIDVRGSSVRLIPVPVG